MTNYDIEAHYQEVLNHLKPNGLNTVDFLGLNIDDNGKIEFKIYYPPKYQMTSTSADNEIENFIIKNNMYRLTCETYSPKGSRHYIVLKNKSSKKIAQLLDVISQSYPWFSNYTNQIMRISEMTVINPERVDKTSEVNKRKSENHSAVHMIGFKRPFYSGESVINIEWLTRKYSSEDEYSLDYLYDDQYYLSFLMSTGDELIGNLCQDANNWFSKEIESEKLHIWLFASDYYEKSNCKHKIYFKCTDRLDTKYILSKIYSWINAENRLRCNIFRISNWLDKFYDDVDSFIEEHKELTLYGFALGLHGNKRTVNLYFIQNSKNSVMNVTSK